MKKKTIIWIIVILVVLALLIWGYKTNWFGHGKTPPVIKTQTNGSNTTNTSSRLFNSNNNSICDKVAIQNALQNFIYLQNLSGVAYTNWNNNKTKENCLALKQSYATTQAAHDLYVSLLYNCPPNAGNSYSIQGMLAFPVNSCIQ